MNKRTRRRLHSLGLCLAALAAAGALSCCGKGDDSSEPAKTESPAEDSFVPQTFNSNVIGDDGGYSYELWKDSGDVELTLGQGGAFSCKWENINNSLFRRGRRFDCTKTYEELGDISIDYGVDYRPDGNSYMCVYGWTREPLVEYYIVETWGSWRPPGQAECLCTVTSDGGTYDIYRTTRVDQPSIDGTKTFDQYWSVRQEKPETDGTRLEGTISVTGHFDAWKKAGLELGKMYEVALNIEGYQSKGSADVYKNILNIKKNSE